LDAAPTHAPDLEAQSRVAAPPVEDFSAALAHGLDLPLSALRASVERLCDAIADDPDGLRAASNVLRQVEHLGRNVRDLLDFASHPRIAPTNCTASEIVLSAHRALPETVRPRVTLARERAETLLCVDVTLAVRSLLRLLERAMDQGSSEILIFARPAGSAVVFGLVDAAGRQGGAPRRPAPDLSLAVARRDLELLSGSLEIRSATGGRTCTTVTLPVHPPPSIRS
jgi:signal transduction histidine kinase